MKIPPDPSALLHRIRLIVCVGTGGVGKTTVAASVALEAARRGRRALVVTIDPARRLADALGVRALGNSPVELGAERLAEYGIEGSGRLYAMMLDMKQTFDDLVIRFTHDPKSRARILDNPIYQHASDALAGSAEYAAMEKLYEMSADERFDTIVLDTPPSQHALDFLDAPHRLIEFLDSRLVRLLVHPAFFAGRLGFRLFQGGTERLLGLIEKVSGVTFLEDISEFLLAFEDMSGGFRERAHKVESLILGPDTGFVLVAGPSPQAARGAQDFIEHLERSRVSLSGIVVNRAHLWPGDEDATREPDPADAEAEARDRAELARALATSSGLGVQQSQDLARAAAELALEYAALVRVDWNSTAGLREHALARRVFFRSVPELARDISDPAGLSQVAAHLFASDSKNAAGAG